MSYLLIQDFKLGMDRRGDRVPGVPGALWDGVNGHINRKGEFERRKKFIPKYTLPTALTTGLAAVAGQLFVFGAGTTPGGLPAGITYQQLAHPTDGTATISRLLSISSFSGKLYIIAQFSDGNIYHYYDGARVVSWDTIAASVSNNGAVASALAARIDAETAYTASAIGSVITITAAMAGTPFTIDQMTVNGGANPDQSITLGTLQPNVALVSEVKAMATLTINGGTSSPGVNNISSVKVNSVEILGASVNWNASNNATAAAIAAQINSYASSPEYTASSLNNQVTILAAAGTGSGPNGYVVVTTLGGNVTASNTDMNGGVTAVAAQAQINTATIGGTFEAADTFTLVLNGINYRVSGGAAGTGIFAITFGQKIYSVTNSLLYFSALSSPTLFGSGIGNGYINISNESEGNEPLVGMGPYQGLMAVFSRNNIRIYSLDVDPSLNAPKQQLPNTGTNCPRSITPYGNLDVFYLHDSGVRSIRARDSSNAPAVNDVGVAIDAFIQAYIKTLSDTQLQEGCSIIEPVDSRYWLALHNRIFVFSYFPGSKVEAWTYYDLTDEIGSADISDMVKINRQTFLRAGDTVYLYGGDDGNTYPNDNECVAEIALPFLAAGTPATFKGITAFDIGLQGTWETYLLPDPDREDVELNIGVFNKNTFSKPQNPIKMPTCMFALRMRCAKAGYGKVNMVAVHYKAEKAT